MSTTTEVFDPQDVQQSKSLVWMSYLGLLFLVPMLVNKNSAYTKFHVNQGIILFIVSIILNVAAAIVGAILGLIPILGAIVAGFISLCVSVIILIFAILGIVASVQGEAKELPIIGKYRILK